MRIQRLRIRNYRALADVTLDLGPITVVFGPNGSGKSTILDSLWFFRDCANRGVELAASRRGHGIGILFDGAGDDQQVQLELMTDALSYGLTLDLAAGRISAAPGEMLVERSTGAVRLR